MEPRAIKVSYDSSIVKLAGRCWRHAIEIRPDEEPAPVRQWRVHQKSSTSPLQVATTEAGCAGSSSPSHGWDARGDGLACDVPCATT